jgi:hypothetical protein
MISQLFSEIFRPVKYRRLRREGVKAGREETTLGSVNGEGATFVTCKRQDWPGKRRNLASRFFTNESSGFINAISDYIVRVPLLLKDMEYQLHAVLSRTDDKEDYPLDQYAVTAHGVKFSSYGILALETGKKAEELENAAQRGDLGFLEEQTPVFLDYMEYFLSGLEQFLSRKKRFRRNTG